MRLAAAIAILGVGLLGLAPGFGSAAPPDPGATRAQGRPVAVERTRYLMGTLCTIAAESADTAAAGWVEAAFDEIARLEEVMSVWRPESELSRLNASADSGFTCSPDLFAALERSLQLAALTGGAFDPTIEPLNRLWDLRGSGRLPEPHEIPRVLAQVGWRRLALDRETRRARFERAGMAVDLGGIGKGLALDRAAAGLRERGVRRALLNFGGEILALGGPHAVTVAHPAERLRPLIRFTVANAAVSTSGQSERGVTVGGKRYGHILDPRTGMPAPDQGSATVVVPSAARADGLSTALLVMGREQAAAFALARPDVGLLWLETADRRVRAWKWNLEAAAPEGTSAVEWMN